MWFSKKNKLNPNEKLVTIKNDWNNVTMSDYFKIKDILSNESFEIDDKMIKLIEVLSDLTYKEIDSLKTNDFMNIVNEINVFIKTEIPKYNIPSKIKLDNKTYYIDSKLTEVKAGQYLMLEQIMKDKSLSADDMVMKSVGVFIRPAPWGDFDYDDNVDFLYEHLSIVQAYSLAAFFLTFQNRLFKSIQHYSHQMTKTQKQKKIKNFMNRKK